MTSRFVASWLVVLAIMPFTAPFSTCDLTGFMGPARRQHSPGAPLRSAGVASDAAVPTVPGISGAGRIRRVPLTDVSTAHTHTVSASIHFASSRASNRFSREHAVFATILRI
jgi:hypothetical protein